LVNSGGGPESSAGKVVGRPCVKKLPDEKRETTEKRHCKKKRVSASKGQGKRKLSVLHSPGRKRKRMKKKNLAMKKTGAGGEGAGGQATG